MKRYYCDACGEELERGDHDRIKGEENINGARISFEVMRGVGGGAMNDGDFCWECQLEAITRYVRSPARRIKRSPVPA